MLALEGRSSSHHYRHGAAATVVLGNHCVAWPWRSPRRTQGHWTT
jgi:hypothetical protein